VLLRRPLPLPVMEVEEADDGILALVVPPVGDVTLAALPSCPGSVLSNLSSYWEDRLSLESLLLRLDTLLAMEERLANEMVLLRRCQKPQNS